MKKILITGGAGFIESHVVRRFVYKYRAHKIFNLDALANAGNLENVADINSLSNFIFIKGDIVNSVFLDELFSEHQF
jgi:dTDP-glucose 4,6-dehydratase